MLAYALAVNAGLLTSEEDGSLWLNGLVFGGVLAGPQQAIMRGIFSEMQTLQVCFGSCTDMNGTPSFLPTPSPLPNPPRPFPAHFIATPTLQPSLMLWLCMISVSGFIVLGTLHNNVFRCTDICRQEETPCPQPPPPLAAFLTRAAVLCKCTLSRMYSAMWLCF